MKIMKKTFALAVAVSLVCLSSVGAMAASKLIVKGTDATTDKFVVTDAGWIGSGTSTPTSALNIVGSSVGATQLLLYNNGGATYNFANSGGMSFARNNPGGTNGGLPQQGDRLGYFTFGGFVSGVGKYSAGISSFAEANWGALSLPAYLAFETAATNTTSRTEKMRITASGNVGISTTTPAQKLEVNGGIRLNPTAARPVCTATIRGTLWYVKNGTGVADSLQVCIKNASEAYLWQPLF